jgi:cell division transport system permease protein
LLGAGSGMAALLLLFNWIKLQFAGPATSSLLPFTFFSWPVVLLIVGLATLLCVIGSFSAIRRFLQL